MEDVVCEEERDDPDWTSDWGYEFPDEPENDDYEFSEEPVNNEEPYESEEYEDNEGKYVRGENESEGQSENRPSEEVGRVYEWKDGDRVLANALETQSRQIKNSCVTASMEDVNHILGGNINEGVFHLEYWRSNLEPITNAGVELSKIESLINYFFSTMEYKSLQESIDENAAVFTTINSGTHSVVVVGYSGSDYVYYDPSYGNCRIAALSEFSQYYIPVNGIRQH